MKHMTKKRLRSTLLAYTLTSLLIAHLHGESAPIQLTSRVLKMIDGMPRAMDGYTILDMKIISNKIRTILYGAYNAETKTRIGAFEFQDKKVSLQTLTRIEQRIIEKFTAEREQLEHAHVDMTRFANQWQEREALLIAEYESELQKIEEEMVTRHTDEEKRYVAIRQQQRAVMRKHNALLAEEIEILKKEHIEDFEGFTTKLEKLEYARAQQLALLAPGLAHAKKQFMAVTLPFMEQARGSKEFMVPLIEEWAQKAGHRDSMLLKWSEEAEGTEMVMFEHDITSCSALYDMCTNLLAFLQSMITSCPKACKQYEQLKDKLSQPTQ